MNKILFVSEASYLSTGYATYSREVMKRLVKMGYEVAELSIYGSPNDKKRGTIPWKNYPNLPSTEDKEGQEKYRSSPLNQFGNWRFERVLADFQPTHVLTIRDPWIDSFIASSPYRPYFKWIWMPTVDSTPNSIEWIDTICQTDALLTYSDWAIDVLKHQAGDSLNVLGSAPPSAQEEFNILDKTKCRESLGISPDARIIGMAARNQRRKLFPDLFRAFRKFLDKTGDVNTYLYIHTSFPDNGWPLGQLIVENNISSRTLISYNCAECGKVFASFFSNTVRQCPQCQKFTAKTTSVSNGVSVSKLAEIYNCMDLYVQYVSNEGYGIPLLEAAACGIPVLATGYSAMESEVPKLNGDLIPHKLYREMETGTYKALPDNDFVADYFATFMAQPEPVRRNKGFKARESFLANFSWDKTAKKWSDAIESVGVVDIKLGWKSPPKSKKAIPPEEFPKFENNKQFMDWMFGQYLGMPEKIGTHTFNAILRDLNQGQFKNNPGGYFYSDMSAHGKAEYQPLTREILVQMLHNKVMERNFWEDVRAGKVQLKQEDWLK